MDKYQILKDMEKKCCYTCLKVKECKVRTLEVDGKCDYKQNAKILNS